uniref:Uncharacterized protein n=1 Tax=Canis lupus familiaris TaxID=9615 RepID=A0A8C0QD88_CANLF
PHSSKQHVRRQEKPSAGSCEHSGHVVRSGEGSVDLSFLGPKVRLFGNTLGPKKTPPRKSASLSNPHDLDRSTREVALGLGYGTPTMNLVGQSLKFENGQRIAETGISGGVDRREEANNLLRLKVDGLRDMLSETAAESRLMEKELEELKSISRRRKKHPEDICQEQREKPIRQRRGMWLTVFCS